MLMSQMRSFLAVWCVTDEKLREIERNTRGQATCERWYEERRKRSTASNIGTVLKRRKSIYPKSLLKTLEVSSNKGCPKACKLSKDNEVEAIQKYMEGKQKQGSSVGVCAACGFIVNPNFPWLGASPDFPINDPNEQASSLGLGEVNAPIQRETAQ